ncbi:MAG: hypothetical protein MUF01_13490, partial [Bryobacterales bacterium]|nr:hypothetical protein [Bryobacterales bacterium]
MAGQTSGVHGGWAPVVGGATASSESARGLRPAAVVAVPGWAPWLALAVVGALVPTGYVSSPSYWNVALLLGGGYALMR